jgi:energy-converting hydrogenase Eha subunit A
MTNTNRVLIISIIIVVFVVAYYAGREVARALLLPRIDSYFNQASFNIGALFGSLLTLLGIGAAILILRIAGNKK